MTRNKAKEILQEFFIPIQDYLHPNKGNFIRRSEWHFAIDSNNEQGEDSLMVCPT